MNTNSKFLLLPGDATLSRHKGINIRDLQLTQQLSDGPSSQTWKGRWQGNAIVAKILVLRECTPRISRDFNEEFPKLRSVVLGEQEIMLFNNAYLENNLAYHYFSFFGFVEFFHIQTFYR